MHIPASVALDDAWLASRQVAGQRTAHLRRNIDQVRRVASAGGALRGEVDTLAKEWLMAILKDLPPTLPRRPWAVT